MQKNIFLISLFFLNNFNNCCSVVQSEKQKSSNQKNVDSTQNIDITKLLEAQNETDIIHLVYYLLKANKYKTDFKKIAGNYISNLYDQLNKDKNWSAIFKDQQKLIETYATIYGDFAENPANLVIKYGEDVGTDKDGNAKEFPQSDI